MTSTTSSSPFSSAVPPTVRGLGVPAAGLAPDAGEPEPGEWDEMWLMQLTNAERARLQENGVPTPIVGRVETLLETLDRQQTEGRGAEGRWALGCLLNRAAEGTAALDAILDILQQRLLPRGFVPLRRVPHSEQQRWSLFQWARNQRDILEGTLSRYLDVGMVPGDTALPAGEGHVAGAGAEVASPASVVGTQAAASTPVEAVSITPTSSARERCGGAAASSSSDCSSGFALNSDGELVSVHSMEDDRETPRGPPVPQYVGTLASALAGGLHGVWAEPADNTLSVEPGAASSGSQEASSSEASSAPGTVAGAPTSLTTEALALSGTTFSSSTFSTTFGASSSSCASSATCAITTSVSSPSFTTEVLRLDLAGGV